jgi:hypothetical protein
MVSTCMAFSVCTARREGTEGAPTGRPASTARVRGTRPETSPRLYTRLHSIKASHLSPVSCRSRSRVRRRCRTVLAGVRRPRSLRNQSRRLAVKRSSMRNTLMKSRYSANPARWHTTRSARPRRERHRLQATGVVDRLCTPLIQFIRVACFGSGNRLVKRFATSLSSSCSLRRAV